MSSSEKLSAAKIQAIREFFATKMTISKNFDQNDSDLDLDDYMKSVVQKWKNFLSFRFSLMNIFINSLFMQDEHSILI